MTADKAASVPLWEQMVREAVERHRDYLGPQPAIVFTYDKVVGMMAEIDRLRAHVTRLTSLGDDMSSHIKGCAGGYMSDGYDTVYTDPEYAYEWDKAVAALTAPSEEPS